MKEQRPSELSDDESTKQTYEQVYALAKQYRKYLITELATLWQKSDGYIGDDEGQDMGALLSLYRQEGDITTRVKRLGRDQLGINLYQSTEKLGKKLFALDRLLEIFPKVKDAQNKSILKEIPVLEMKNNLSSFAAQLKEEDETINKYRTGKWKHFFTQAAICLTFVGIFILASRSRSLSGSYNFFQSTGGNVSDQLHKKLGTPPHKTITKRKGSTG